MVVIQLYSRQALVMSKILPVFFLNHGADRCSFQVATIIARVRKFPTASNQNPQKARLEATSVINRFGKITFSPFRPAESATANSPLSTLPPGRSPRHQISDRAPLCKRPTRCPKTRLGRRLVWIRRTLRARKRPWIRKILWTQGELWIRRRPM
ncbi:hypothetical protein FA13DRAFT_986704 [Coprinellus micaceus]|uniref:Uncharacterized protein n=1 Tax=Coprinellus micaceus TaxID=71717 RepID=A0A4Y7SYN6_COPMI|nr:hypothetical protein FA13DRAFT_986704 [Coprinellus micaceus]